MNERERYRLTGWIVMIIVMVIILLCSDGNSQDCDESYRCTKEQMNDRLIGVSPIYYGVYECIAVGTNLSMVADTIMFVIMVQKEGQDAELFGIYEVYPDGSRKAIPTMHMVMDERIGIGVSLNAPVGTTFNICLKQIYEKQKALLYK